MTQNGTAITKKKERKSENKQGKTETVQTSLPTAGCCCSKTAADLFRGLVCFDRLLLASF